MDSEKQDRRIRRTRKLLKNSLISLMGEKEFKNISVKDITERADLNRGTFYLHYDDTYHLLQDIENEVLQDFQNMIRKYDSSSGSQSLLPVMNPLISYIADNTAICKILFENNASTEFLNRLHVLIHENGREIISSIYPNISEQTMDYYFEFITYGLIGMLRQWLDTGKKLPGHCLAELADRAIISVAESLNQNA